MEDPQIEMDEEQRRAEAATEAFLRAQEDNHNDNNRQPHHDHDDERYHVDGNEEDQEEDDEENDLVEPRWMNEAPPEVLLPPEKSFRLSYVSTSFIVAFAMIFYALRTQQQWYLTVVYLSSSKWAYIVFGNAFVATLITIFSIFTNFFLDGLRLHEAEGLSDFFRWNITETCIALTIFRADLTVQTGILFLILVLQKSLHWVVELREQHLRMTQEAVVVHPSTGWPGLQWPHLKIFFCLMLLQLLDILAVLHYGYDIAKNGASVSMLFAFEAAILLVSIMSSILLWYLHVLDGMINYAHEVTQPGNLFHGWIHPWKDYKATLVFAVEVQAQACKFFFYLPFFAMVMTYYGLPINLFREVYMSFQSLKQRLLAFAKYRQLMASMNRFENPTQEELDEAGSTCIICRDEMTIITTKRLPGCGHLFHKSCLREWLVQQQSCPTCRGDITAMQERQRQRDAAVERQQQQEQEQQQQQQQENTDVNGTGGVEEGPRREVESMSTATLGDNRSLRSPNLKDAPYMSNPETSPKSGKPIIKTESRSMEWSEEDDKKPAAVSFAPRREKHVRIQLPHDHTADSDPLRNERPAFPAFYRITEDEGASVYNDGDAVSFVIRVVPFGVIILGQELAWRRAGEDGEGRLMVRMPDGWVKDCDVERITAVPL